MSLPVYDIDKEWSFDRLVMIELGEQIEIFGQNCMGTGIQITEPSFLARFRKVNYDGSLSSIADTSSIAVPSDSRIVIRLDGTIGVLFPNSTYYEFSGVEFETLIRVPFPMDEFGEFGSYIGYSLFGFNEFLDSFKTRKVKTDKSLRRNVRERYKEGQNNADGSI
jgi:hypothetical protein